MKKLNSKLLFFTLALFSLSSCLKKGNENIDTGKGPANLVEFANTGDNVSGALSTYPRFATDLGSVKSDETVYFNVNISYSGANTAPQDITVNLEVDPTALATFNSENGTNFVAPPSAIYDMPMTAVIKKGERQVTIQVGITNNASFDFNVNYALPLKIASASTGSISGNFGKALYSFSARNSYDGVYLMEATAPMADAFAPGLSGWYPIYMQLITFTGNSVALYDGINYVNAYGHPIKNGSSGSYYGTFSPVFIFDNTGKITEVTNYYGQNAGSLLRSAEIDPAGVNQATFNGDGSIKSFEVSYYLVQGGTQRTHFSEKFTYTEPR